MVHVSLWDFLWAQSFIPVSGSCWPSFGLWLLLKCAPGPYCHPKVNWLLSAGHLLLSAALLDVTLPTVRVHHDTTTASTSQEGSSKTECRVSPRQGELWLQTCFAGLFPLAAPSGREGQRGNKPYGSLWFSPRSEVSPGTCPEETTLLQPPCFGLYNAELRGFCPVCFSWGLPEEKTNQPLSHCSCT